MNTIFDSLIFLKLYYNEKGFFSEAADRSDCPDDIVRNYLMVKKSCGKISESIFPLCFKFNNDRCFLDVLYKEICQQELADFFVYLRKNSQKIKEQFLSFAFQKIEKQQYNALVDERNTNAVFKYVEQIADEVDIPEYLKKYLIVLLSSFPSVIEDLISAVVILNPVIQNIYETEKEIVKKILLSAPYHMNKYLMLKQDCKVIKNYSYDICLMDSYLLSICDTRIYIGTMYQDTLVRNLEYDHAGLMNLFLNVRTESASKIINLLLYQHCICVKDICSRYGYNHNYVYGIIKVLRDNKIIKKVEFKGRCDYYILDKCYFDKIRMELDNIK